MRKVVTVSLATLVLLLAASPTLADAHGRRGVRTGVFIGVGPGWWGPPPYWWYYPPPYYVYAPPPVVVEQPTVYIQQQPVLQPSAQQPPAQQPASQQPGQQQSAQQQPAGPPPAYWYYCPSANAYYPSVPTCPEAWVKVPPRTE